MKVIVAITGASGAIYARKYIECLLRAPEVERIALIVSRNGQSVMEYEGQSIPASDRIMICDNDDMFSPAASGSADYDTMTIIPASMGSVGRIAAGISQTLIERAADVMLKECRRLLVVVRESPFSLIHLRNMTALTEAGATIIPASPSFYSCPQNLDEAVMTVVERVVAHSGIKQQHYEFEGKHPK